MALALARLQKQGKPYIDLTASNPTACGFDYPQKLLHALSNERNLRYGPSPLGDLRAREAIAKLYAKQGICLDADNIVLTGSTSEAYSFVLRLLVNPGERVLFPAPSYPLLDHLAQLNDVYVDTYRLHYDGAWSLDLDSLQAALHEDTRAVVVVHPNNPTGSFLKQQEQKQLQALCASHKIAVISDEVFLDYAYERDKNRARSLTADSQVLTFTLGGASKMLGLPQMKIAWICVSGPKELRKEALQRLEMIADTYLSVNTPAQQALPQWLSLKKDMQSQILRRVLDNRRALEKHAWHKLGCEVLACEGGWYAVFRVPRTKSEEEWVLEILAKQNVLVHPGYFFDFEKEAYLVMSLLVEPAVFLKAIDRIWGLIQRD